ncbi:lysine-specific demethylase JMJ25-like [Zingiber officinale]|uniref:lysine-specific demethylase JMJ25-like n=1 Tax=Zingiber officinale TaxID=94328 RepID=UPI001C4CC921|nr:lysine-specific demethylase JMJ25-like [Zingiber officinale]
MPQPRRLYDDSDAVPGEGDAFRCRRSDGKKWRCRKRVMDGLSFCEYHYVQIRANLERHKASAANPRNRARKAEAPAEEDPIAAAPKRRRVKRAAEKERQKGEEEDKEAGTTRVLPNGLMTIVATTSPSGGHGGYESGSVGPKVGVEEGRLLTRRRIRSKNAEPIPVATIKKIPCGKKRICHSCREKNVLGMVRCLSCRKRSFCSRCLKKRYSGMLEKEAKTACPVCRGCCDCKACSSIRPNDDRKELVNGQMKFKKREHTNCHEISQIQEPTNDRNKYKNTEHAYNLISQLLPLLKNIYLNQLNELEMIEPHREVGFSGISLQVDEPHNEIAKCNCCRISLVDFHRSCSRCSYKLCLSCYQKMPNETASPAHASDSPDEMKQILSTGVPSDNSSLSTIKSGSKEGEQSLSCPHTQLGGCSNGLLKLNFTMPFCSKYLRKTVEDAAAFSSDRPRGLHPPCCSDQKIGQFTISLQEASHL